MSHGRLLLFFSKAWIHPPAREPAGSRRYDKMRLPCAGAGWKPAVRQNAVPLKTETSRKLLATADFNWTGMIVYLAGDSSASSFFLNILTIDTTALMINMINLGNNFNMKRAIFTSILSISTPALSPITPPSPIFIGIAQESRLSFPRTGQLFYIFVSPSIRINRSAKSCAQEDADNGHHDHYKYKCDGNDQRSYKRDGRQHQLQHHSQHRMY